MIKIDRESQPVWEDSIAVFNPNPGFDDDNARTKWRIDDQGFAWVMFQQSDGNHTRLQKMSPSGERLFGERGIDLSDDVNKITSLLTLGSDGVWLTMKKREANGHFRLGVIHIDREGRRADGGGVPL